MKHYFSKPRLSILVVALVLFLVFVGGCNDSNSQTQVPTDRWDIFAETEDSKTQFSNGALPVVVPRKVTGDLRIAGSSTAEPLILFAAERFRALGYEGTITIESPGSLGALRGWQEGEDYDLVFVSVPVDAGIDAVILPLVQDALGVAVPRSNTFVQDLSLDSLALLFSTARTWNQVESTWPELRVTKMSPGPDSGTYQRFAQTVFGGESRLLHSPFVQMSEDDSILVRGIAQGAGTVGYLGYSYLKDRQEELRLLSIDGVSISPETIENGEYPLNRTLSVIVDRRTLAANPAALGFLSYLLSVGTEDLEDLGFFSLSSTDRAFAETTLRELYRGIP